MGTANPPDRYTQDELLALLGVTDRRIRALFRSSHIRHRHLILPRIGAGEAVPDETPLELLNKHRRNAVELGSTAICEALSALDLAPADVDCIVGVTSTGFLCPGLSALWMEELGMRDHVARLDVVGMGCNAGLNGLQPASNFCVMNPGKVALLVCAEICSAVYVLDDSVGTAVVNSLFGDGVAAAVLRADGAAGSPDGPTIMGFESTIIIEAIDAMRFDFDGRKYAFFLDPEIPYAIGRNVERPVERLLRRFDLNRRDIRHWVVHSGGRKVIDAIKYNLGLTDHDVRHTKSVLRDYGNLSSGSFLFSYRRLLEEGTVAAGDLGVMITMGPGSTIETCLIRF